MKKTMIIPLHPMLAEGNTIRLYSFRPRSAKFRMLKWFLKIDGFKDRFKRKLRSLFNSNHE